VYRNKQTTVLNPQRRSLVWCKSGTKLKAQSPSPVACDLLTWSCKQRETDDLLLLPNYLYSVSFSSWRLLVAQLVEALRYSRMVAGSIPDGFIGTFH
jgi:hypothetical protein